MKSDCSILSSYLFIKAVLSQSLSVEICLDSLKQKVSLIMWLKIGSGVVIFKFGRFFFFYLTFVDHSLFRNCCI